LNVKIKIYNHFVIIYKNNYLKNKRTSVNTT